MCTIRETGKCHQIHVYFSLEHGKGWKWYRFTQYHSILLFYCLAFLASVQVTRWLDIICILFCVEVDWRQEAIKFAITLMWSQCVLLSLWRLYSCSFLDFFFRLTLNASSVLLLDSYFNNVCYVAVIHYITHTHIYITFVHARDIKNYPWRNRNT